MSDLLSAKFNLQTQDRITAHCNLYHEHWGEEPFAVSVATEVYLENQEQPFQRRLQVRGEWLRLAAVWGSLLSEVGLLLLENRTGQNLLTRPDDAKLNEIAAAVVELGLEVDGAVHQFADIQAGMFSAFSASRAERLWVRCACGVAALNVAAFPR